MERGYIDTPRLYVLLTRGNVVGEKILRILGSLTGAFVRYEVSRKVESMEREHGSGGVVKEP